MPVPVPAEWLRNPSDTLAVEQGCWFDPEAGQIVCDFIEGFCHQSLGGQWAGKPIVLLEWQRDFLMRLFGWRQGNGLRRYSRAYVEVAKKNGKTTLLAALQLYLLLCDDDGPEIYINACDREQAGKMYEESAKMVAASPELKGRINPVPYKKRLLCPERHGMIVANSADAPNKDGFNASAVIFDELHRQPNSALWDVFRYAGSARREPLTISITTAGESEDGVWFHQREYSEKVERGDIPDTTHLGIVFRPRSDADIDDPAVWRQANPSLGVTIDEAKFKLELEEAKLSPADLANFKRLRLNIIARESGLFLAPEQWSACGPTDGSAVKVDHMRFRGLPCYLGFDLSAVTDLTALVAIWGDEDDGFDVACWFYLPEDDIVALERRDRQSYRALAAAGWITLTPGNAVDYQFLRREIKDVAAEHDLRSILGDPHMAHGLLTQLKEDDGLPVEPIRQGFISLNDPTKQLQRLVLSKKIRHGNNPVLKWMAGNAAAETDAAGCVKLSKKRSRQKIDGMAALVNAVAATTAGGDGGSSVYESRGVTVI